MVIIRRWSNTHSLSRRARIYLMAFGRGEADQLADGHRLRRQALLLFGGLLAIVAALSGVMKGPN